MTLLFCLDSYLISHGEKIRVIQVFLVTQFEAVDHMYAALKVQPVHFIDTSWYNTLTALQENCRRISLCVLFSKDPDTPQFLLHCSVADDTIIYGSIGNLSGLTLLTVV